MTKKKPVKKNIQIKDSTLSGRLSSGFLPYFFIIILPLVIFARSYSFHFSYFDDKIIFDNLSKIISSGSLSAIFSHDAFFSGTGMPFYRPLQNLTFVVDFLIGGNNAQMPHITNLLLHISVCVTLFIFLKKIGIRKLESLLLTLFFSVNPLLCHAICWVPSRGDLLLGLTGLLYFNSMINYFKSGKNKDLILHSLAGFAAVLSKESALVLPFIGVIIIYSVQKEILKKKYIVSTYLIFAVEFLIYLLLRNSVVTYTISNSNISMMNLLANLRTMPEISAKFIYPGMLSPIPAFSMSLFIPGILLLFGVAFALFLSKDGKYKFATAGFAIFVLAILPTLIYSNPKPDTAYDYLEHRAYLPVIGFLLIFAEIIRHFKLSRYIPILIAPVVIFSAYSFYYSKIYSDPKAFFGRAIDMNCNCALAYYNYGVYLRDEGFKKTAMYNFNQAISFDPTYSDAYFDRANLFQDQQNNLYARRDYLKAIETNTKNEKAYNNLGILNGSENKLAEALDDFNHAIALNPGFAEAYSNRGLALMNLSRVQESLNDFNMSISLDPKNPNSYFNRALLYQMTNNMMEACNDWRMAYNLGHNGAKAYLDKYCR